MTDSITITIPVPDTLCADILCNAFEGGQCGIGYWACADDVEHGSEDPLNELYYKSISIFDAECDEPEESEWRHKVDYDAIRRGLQLVLSPEFKVNDTIRGYVQAGVVNNDAGNIDAEAADVIVQAACFGKLVYG